MSNDLYGPLAFLIGSWKSDGWTGENQAPAPDRSTENTNFRQEMKFEPIGDVENHEQLLYALKYSTKAWEEGDDDPFHEEVGYWIWDAERKLVMKSFIVPRGISVNAGGECSQNATNFEMKAELDSNVFGICSNPFLDKEFKTLSYELKVNFDGDDKFTYWENTRIKIKGREQVFDHIERNSLVRI